NESKASYKTPTRTRRSATEWSPDWWMRCLGTAGSLTSSYRVVRRDAQAAVVGNRCGLWVLVSGWGLAHIGSSVHLLDTERLFTVSTFQEDATAVLSVVASAAI
ncbi:hypothetical protein, partial [Azospirillum sp. TSO35-2]|uniref:hypothetical protein n=1 Tax=Azospirillum sp. TSO35-2 TaxID=716796 RepID=UPI001B3BF8E3